MSRVLPICWAQAIDLRDGHHHAQRQRGSSGEVVVNAAVLLSPRHGHQGLTLEKPPPKLE